MADESLKTIKQKLTEFNKLVKQGKELTAVQEQELRTLRAQKKELSERSKWQRKILDNQMSSVKQNENLAKLIELQKKKEQQLKKIVEKKNAIGTEYQASIDDLTKQLGTMVEDSEEYNIKQQEILDKTEEQAKAVKQGEEQFGKAEKSLNAQIGLSESLAKIQQDQIDNNMKAVQGELTEADVAQQLVDIAAAEKVLDENKENLSKKQLMIGKQNLKQMKDKLRSQESMNDYAKVRGDMESKLDDISGGLIGKFKGMKAQAAQINKVAAKHPYVALAMIIIGIIAIGAKLVKQTMELRKEFGLSVGETVKLQGAMMGASAQLYLLGVSAEEVKATAGALIDEFGSVNNVTKDTLVSLGKMHATLGIAGADAVKLLGAMEGVSSASRETLMAQMKVTGELAQAAGVAPAKVMKDLADNTEMFADFAVDGGENLAKAAIQAAKLGINMGTVSKMADSLLDFESSIESQMEASMMLGRQINTDKARQLALSGDLEGMQKEVMKQVGNEADFAKMNVLQRRSLAKAFGLSTEELSKMVRDQEKINNMSAEELAAQKKRQELLALMSQTWTTIVTALKDGLMPVLSFLGTVLSPFITGLQMIAPILGPIVKILGIMVAVIGILAIVSWAAASPWIWIPLAIMGVVGIVSLLMKKFKSFGEFVKFALKMAFAPLFLAWEAMKAVGNFIGGLFGGGEEKKPAEAASPAVSMAAGGVVNSSTTAEIGEAGSEAVVPLGDKFDLTETNKLLTTLITQSKEGTDKLNKNVSNLGVAG